MMVCEIHVGLWLFVHNSPSIFTGVMVGLSESFLTAYEDKGSIQVCAELLKGTLGKDIALIIDSEIELNTDSGLNC